VDKKEAWEIVKQVYLNELNRIGKEVKTNNAFIKAGVGHSSHETMMREYRYEDMKKAYKIVFGGD